MFLDRKGRVGLAGFGAPSSALSVGGAIDAVDVRMSSDDRLIAKRKPLTSEQLGTISKSFLANLEVSECHWLDKASAGSADVRRRLGFLSSSEGGSPDVSTQPTVCVSANQAHRAAGSDPFLASVTHTDEAGFKSVSVARLMLLLAAAIKDNNQELAQFREQIFTEGSGNSVTARVKDLEKALAEEKTSKEALQKQLEAVEKRLEEIARQGASRPQEPAPEKIQENNDKQALQRYFFQIIGELEAAQRQHKGLEPAAPLPAEDTKRIRDQALASVKARKNDMAALREMGL